MHTLHECCLRTSRICTRALVRFLDESDYARPPSPMAISKKMGLTMHPRRIHNDCVPRFFSTAAQHFISNTYTAAELFNHFANSLDEKWRQTGSLPAPSEAKAIEFFGRVNQRLALDLNLRVERLRNIPYGLYFDRASELLASNCFLGIGYRARYIFGTTSNDLHVSGISHVRESGVNLIDPEIDGDQSFTWETIEVAALSADSGLWIVSEAQH